MIGQTMIGRTISHCRIIEELGGGGMGVVYKTEDIRLHRLVALKFLPEEASRNPRLLERFHGEVRIARLVSHPNVCRVFDIGEVNGTNVKKYVKKSNALDVPLPHE